jgi:hypothetical protein
VYSAICVVLGKSYGRWLCWFMEAWAVAVANAGEGVCA